MTLRSAEMGWLNGQAAELGPLAARWFERMRACGPDVRDVMHDGCPTACVEDAAFAYVGVYNAHVNVGFFRGADLHDPRGLLEGTGKRMRHVRIRPGADLDSMALAALIDGAGSGSPGARMSWPGECRGRTGYPGRLPRRCPEVNWHGPAGRPLSARARLPQSRADAPRP